jgi:hypothetical protein
MTQVQKFAVFAVLLILFFIGLSFIPGAFDYNLYVTTARAWLSSETRLYDNQTRAYYYMPWSLLFTIPLSAFPDRWGQGILSLVSLLGIIFSIRVLIGRIPWWGIFMVIANLFTFNLLFSGQWDGLILGSIGLGWWSIKEKHPLVLGLALIIMGTKPTNIWLVMGMLPLYIVKKWDLRYFLKTLLIPSLALISSFWISGIDWPLRYINYLNNQPPIPANFNQTTWHLSKTPSFNVLIIILIVVISIVWLVYINTKYIESERGSGISFILLVNLLISNFVTTYHYIYTMPALGWLSREKWYFSVAVYGLMVVYILGLMNIVKSPPYFFYPFFILALCFFTTTQGNISTLVRKLKKSRV